MITTDYVTFADAFSYFNLNLFDNKLPEVIFTITRKKNSAGYFAFRRFESRTGGTEKVSEISVNPMYFRVSDDIEILSTLVHEMVHLWQFTFGEPSRESYHDKEWAKKMEDIGLIPSSTGAEGGKKTGQKMSHYIDDNGMFKELCTAFLVDHKLEWQSIADEEKEPKEKKKNPKFVYVCMECPDVEVTSKVEVRIIHEECGKELVLLEENEVQPE